MREVKFRYTVKRDNGCVFSGIFTLKEIENGAVFAWANANLVDIEQVTKEQFTGLRDKKGREIYEGDLCAITDPYNGVTACAARVIFSHEYDGGWVLTSDGNNRLNIGTRTQYVAVIGNIHKNPELLEEI